jgi:hypothetical protein
MLFLAPPLILSRFDCSTGMGTYLYSVRTTNALNTNLGKVHRLDFLCKLGSYTQSAQERRLVSACKSIWEDQGVTSFKGLLVYTGKKPTEDCLVLRYSQDKPYCTDATSFGEPVGFLRRVEGEWRVEPV